MRRTNKIVAASLAATVDYDDTAATVTGLEPEYTIGETAVFNVTAKPGYVAKVLVNGKDVTNESGEYSYIFRGKLNVRVISAPDSGQSYGVDIGGADK